MTPRKFSRPAILLLPLILSACAAPHHPGAYPATYPSGHRSTYPAVPASSYPAPAYTRNTGVVESIQLVPGAPQQDIGAGAVIGGVVGGLLGNQVGGGSGKKAATVAGVVGGAMVGHQIERRQAPPSTYQVGVRMHDGRYLTVAQDDVRELRIGAQVRLENQRLYPLYR